MKNPLAPALPPMGAHGALRCLCITCTGNFYTVAEQEYSTLATGDAPAAVAEPRGALL